MKRAYVIVLMLLMGVSLFGCKAAIPTPVETNKSDQKTDVAEEQTKASGQESEIPGVIGTKDEVSEMSGELQKYVKRKYQGYEKRIMEELKQLGISEQDQLVIQGKKNLQELEKLAYKAYTNSAASFYCEDRIKYGDEPEKVRRHYFDKDLGTRVEESIDGELISVDVLDSKSDIKYTYNAKKDRLEKVSNASKKGYQINLYEIECFETNGNNANNPKNVFEEVDYNGTPAVKFSIKEKSPDGEEFYNAVWFDAERGVLLCELQERPDGRFETTFNVKSNLKFDSAVFTFDQKKPTVKDMMVK